MAVQVAEQLERVTAKTLEIVPWGQHRKLQNDVERFCKNNGRQACGALDSCPTLQEKLNLNLACAKARDRINSICFDGGDEGHREASDAAWGAVAKCTNWLMVKACENCPTE